MKWLRAFRSSTIFVDVLLLIVAVVAIMGLTMFVHFNGKKALGNTALKTPVADAEAREAQAIANPNPDSNQETKTDTATKPSSENSPSTQDAVAQTTPALPANQLVKATCDSAKRTQASIQYNKDVSKENSSFEESIVGLPLLSPLYSTLKTQHTNALSVLETNYSSLLRSINCA